MTQTGKVVVMIPALNEERSIGHVIDSIPRSKLASMGFEVETIVLDGKSTDRTLDIAREKGARIDIQNGNGKGSALRQAFSLRNPQEVVLRTLSLTSAIDSDLNSLSILLDSKYVIILDGDGTYPPACIPDLIESLEQGHDVVSGSRFKGTIEAGAMTGFNRLGNKMLSLIASALYFKKVTDLCTGMWGFNTAALKGMNLDSTHFDIEAEMFAECAKNGMRIEEVPITYLKRSGESKLMPMSAGFMIFRKLFQRRFSNASRPEVPVDKQKDKEVVRAGAGVGNT